MAPSAFPLLPITSARTLRWIEAMEPVDRSVFITSYPKSGTTWLQYIVWQIVAAHRESTGGPPLDLAHISDFAPFLEADRTWEWFRHEVHMLLRCQGHPSSAASV